MEFTKALPDFINKKYMKFFFQIGKGKYDRIFGKIIVTWVISIVSTPVKVVVLVVFIVIVFVNKS